MPFASRVAIRLALAWLVLGMTAGVLVAAARAGTVGPVAYRAIEVHTSALVIGWFAQLVVAVAFWMLPKHPTDRPRGDEGVFLAGIIVLNVALAIRGILVMLTPWGPSVIVTAAVPAAFVLCASQLWPRVKPFGDPSGASR